MSPARPAPEIEMTWDQALSWRIRRQLLHDPVSEPVEAVSILGGVQTQLASSAVQVLTIRGRAVPDLDELLWVKRSLVRTWAMRGTLHLLPASELGVWIAALSQRKWRITPSWEKYHGITRSQLDTITEAMPLVLSDTPLTRDELTEAVVRHTGDVNLGRALGSGWSQVLKPAANQGLLAQGPPAGRNITFVAPGMWIGAEPSRPSPETAMGAVIERFLDANGPATVEDFGRWFGVDARSARELMTPHVARLVPVSIEGQIAWMTTRGAGEVSMAEPGHGTFLLPAFDPFTLAPISHRDHTIPPGRVDEVSRAAGWIAPVVVENGRIIGTWQVLPGTITLNPFGRLPRATLAAINDHVERRYRGLLGEDLRYIVGK